MRGIPVIHQTLDRCDVCGKKLHKKDLVRTQVRYNRPSGNNYFSYSHYDGTFWQIAANCTAHTEDMGLGPDAEDCRAKIDESNTVTEIRGAKTFLLSPAGEAAIIYTGSSTDISSFTRFVFGVYVGQYHANADQAALTVAIGNCDAAASVLYELKSKTIRTGQHIWVAADIADLDSNVDTSATYWYVSFTASSDEDYYFWVDWMQLEKDATRPGAFISTAGAAVDHTSETKIMTSAKVCSRCREKLTLEGEKYGRHRREVEPPIEDDFQEA